MEIRLVELDEKIRPGMSCDADIQTETRTDVIHGSNSKCNCKNSEIEKKVKRLLKTDSLNTDKKESKKPMKLYLLKRKT